ncbi:Antirestriction protein ArdC [Hymenobacter daecheongensis DSM 21074]|uniref:Antirestriction protein ArdC n=1 Tax=Hymenobacter daecheongensis DSM 21074 TaxID=1121955 RepID=A0A1M6M901_9BACT|nr:zincin-like metallopeptidase domain-containing protein [Hymenobacter daecheongensis]SHJ79763.1 Antirestriction protein ArdC [Hymenobacter daecheongensis DSM 21074]
MKKTTKSAAKKSTSKATAARPDVYQIVTDRIISALEGGIIPWRKPWNAVYGLPRNYATGRVYSGINLFLLHFSGALPFFMTFKQALEMGGNVRKGAKGHQVVYYNVSTRENKQTGKEEKMPFLKYYTVFSVEDIEGIEFDLPKVEKREFTPSEVAEGIVEAWDGKPAIQHLHQRAYYSPSLDFVNMPKPETFTTSEGYYQTLFHELTHSTGHKARLDRADLTAGEGKQSLSYAREELTAEMGASFLSAAAGIATEQTEENAVAYIQSWLERLKNDKQLVIKAASKAQKAAELILGHTNEPDEPQAQEQPAEQLQQPERGAVMVAATSEAAPELDAIGREYAAAELSWLAAA